jgi:hypothetical protein
MSGTLKAMVGAPAVLKDTGVADSAEIPAGEFVASVQPQIGNDKAKQAKQDNSRKLMIILRFSWNLFDKG